MQSDTGPETFAVAVFSGGSPVQRYSASTRSLSTWYHVAVVYNASAGTLDEYVNGVLNDGVVSGSIPASQINSAVNVNVGRRTGGFNFDGIIVEVRVYNRALTQAEIQSDMNTPISTDSQPPTAPSSLSTTVVSDSQINLNWAASTDNVRSPGTWLRSASGRPVRFSWSNLRSGRRWIR